MERPQISYDPEIEIDDAVLVEIGVIRFWCVCRTEDNEAVNNMIAFEVREGVASGMWQLARSDEWDPDFKNIYDRFAKKHRSAAVVTAETFWKVWHELTDPYLFPKKKGKITVEVPLKPETPPDIVADWLQDNGLEKVADAVRQYRHGDDHKGRHEMLHKHLDELAADYLAHNPKKNLSSTTLMHLMQWSYAQTQNPTELE